MTRLADMEVTHKGVTRTVAEWAERLGCSVETIRGRLRAGWEPWRACVVRVEREKSSRFRAALAAHGHMVSNYAVYGRSRRALSGAQVLAIRRRVRSGESVRALASEYGVRVGVVRRVADGLIYRDVPDVEAAE